MSKLEFACEVALEDSSAHSVHRATGAPAPLPNPIRPEPRVTSCVYFRHTVVKEHNMDREHVKGAADKVKGAIKDTGR